MSEIWCWGSLSLSVNSEGPRGSLLCWVRSFTSHFRGWKETHTHCCWPKVTAASVRKTESESSFKKLMGHLNDQAITVCRITNIRVVFFTPHVIFSDCRKRFEHQRHWPVSKASLPLLFHFELRLLYSTLLHWHIAWHMNGNSVSLWQTASLW